MAGLGSMRIRWRAREEKVGNRWLGCLWLEAWRWRWRCCNGAAMGGGILGVATVSVREGLYPLSAE